MFGLACEKVGMYDDALRFADMQVAPFTEGGRPEVKWAAMAARACKGRVFAKLNRHDEALISFQAAIATSKESYNLMEAFAYRELSNYTAGGDAAVQAGVDLKAKLKTFEGRMTRADFDRLTIGPGPIVDTLDVVTEQVSVVDEQVTGALISHLATVLGVPKDVAIIKQYGAALRSEGWDTPEVRHGCRCRCGFGAFNVHAHSLIPLSLYACVTVLTKATSYLRFFPNFTVKGF